MSSSDKKCKYEKALKCIIGIILPLQALRKLQWSSCSDEAKEEERVNNVESLFREASILKCIQVRGGHKNIVNFQFCCTSLDNREVFLGLEYFKGWFNKFFSQH